MASVYLRALEMSDLENTHKWHSDQELYKTLGGSFRYVSVDAEKEWLMSKVKFLNQEINLAICLVETSELIGIASVREIDWISRRGHYAGLFIGESKFQGKGYGTEATKLLLHHCFCDLGLNKLFGYVIQDNEAALKIYNNCGFKVEGTLEQHVFKDGRFTNEYIIGLCADEYFKDNIR